MNETVGEDSLPDGLRVEVVPDEPLIEEREFSRDKARRAFIWGKNNRLIAYCENEEESIEYWKKNSEAIIRAAIYGEWSTTYYCPFASIKWKGELPTTSGFIPFGQQTEEMSIAEQSRKGFGRQLDDLMARLPDKTETDCLVFRKKEDGKYDVIFGWVPAAQSLGETRLSPNLLYLEAEKEAGDWLEKTVRNGQDPVLAYELLLKGLYPYAFKPCF